MNIQQKIAFFFFFFLENKIKAYFKAVILSLKFYKNILNFNFLMRGY